MQNILQFKKFGFTLAEVLITLGVIGIVTALTLPSVVANYQNKKQYHLSKNSITKLTTQ